MKFDDSLTQYSDEFAIASWVHDQIDLACGEYEVLLDS